MKLTYRKSSLLTILVFLLAYSSYGQITYESSSFTNGSEYLTQQSTTVGDDGHTRNTYANGVTIIWTVAGVGYSRWEITKFIPFVGTITLFYSDIASYPNPPDLTLGNWTGSGTITTLTGDVQNTITPPVTISTSQTNATGNGLNDGTATVTVSGGIPPYLYVWNDGQTTVKAVNLVAGNYTVIVTDDNGNGNSKISNTITITEPVAPTFTSTAITAVNEENAYIYNITTNDVNGDAVAVTATTKPSWLSLSAATTTVSSLAFSTGISQRERIRRQSLRGVSADASGNVYVVVANPSHKIYKISPSGVVTTLAGSTGGFANGTGIAAQFSSPSGLAVDASGNVYVADTGNHRIRKISPSGVVTTLAGSTQGFSEGTGTAAQFSNPYGVSVDGLGNVYVGDSGNHRIRKISPSGVVTTLAGSTSGFANGVGTAAQFRTSKGVSVDVLGNVYVADAGNFKIRKISPSGVVTTLAGSTYGFAEGRGAAAQFEAPVGVSVDTSGNVYVVDVGNFKMRKITPSGLVSTLAEITGSHNAVYVDVSGTVYVADNVSDKIRKITESALLTGDSTGKTGVHNVVLKAADGNGGITNQSFTITVKGKPTVTLAPATTVIAKGATLNGNVTSDNSATITERGFVYALTANDSSPTLAEVNSTTVFKVIVTGTTGVFTKALTGLNANSDYSVIAFATNSVGTTESSIKTFTTINTAPTFASTAVTSVDQGNAYTYNITTNDVDGDAVTVTATTLPSWLTLNSREVSTFAGSTNGFANGTGIAAQFNSTFGIAIDGLGTIYVADSQNHKIRKITADGVVTTLAGSTKGFMDGVGTVAQFDSPRGIAVDVSGNVYVADSYNNRIRKISPTGVVTTLAGYTRGFTNGVGTAAQFDTPSGVAVDASGNVFVAESSNSAIRKITSGGVVTTLAGGTSGYKDGVVAIAQFKQPMGIAIDAAGNLYVADTFNHRIRKISLAGVVTTLAGSGTSSFADGIGTAASFSAPRNITVDSSGNIYVADTFNKKIRKITLVNVVTTVAVDTQFVFPKGVAINSFGDIYVSGSDKIKKISKNTVLTGTPTAADVGTHNVVLKADDGNGGAVNQSFTITVKGKPTLTTAAATTITASRATVNGNVTANGGATITERGFVYALTANDSSLTLAEVNNTTVFKVIVTGTTGAFTKALTGLNANSGYSVIAFATNSVGTTESSIKIFTTINTAPTFTSTAVTSVNEGSAYTYNITTNDVDGDAVTVTAITKPSWLTFGKIDILSTIGAGTVGNTDGDKTTAQFHDPTSIAVDASGNMYVGTNGNYTGTHIQIRKITPDGIVSTFAGGGSSGSLDGTGTNATFSSIYGMDIDDTGNVYVADGNSVRKITPERVVTTLGTINQVTDVVVDSEGNVYGAEYNTGHLYKIVPGSAAVLFAHSATGGSQVAGLSIDDSNNVYISSRGGKIFKVTPAAVVTEEFSGLTINGGLAHDANGDFYYTANGVVNKLDFSNGVETTVMSGIGQTWGVDVSTSGNVYAVDRSNHQIKTKVNNGSVLTGNTLGNVGSHNVTLSANDSNGGTVNQSFTITVNDVTAPTITNFSPFDGATEITLNSNLLLTFNENIYANTGNISIYDASDDSLVETINVTSGNVATTNKLATINPTTALAYNKSYYVKVATTAFKDASNNNFAGITDKTTWRFATELRVAPTITFANVNKTYGDANFNLAATSNSQGTITYSIIGAANGTSLSGINNKTASLGNAATITVRATQAVNGQYAASTKDITLTIDKATITATADNKSKEYGAVNPAFTIRYSGFKNGETKTVLDTAPTVSSTATATTNVGTADITVIGGSDNNYIIATEKGILTIGKATLIVTAKNTTINYGDNFSIDFEYGTFKNGEDASVLDTGAYVYIVGSSPYNVGTYTIKPDAVSDNNYTPSYINGTLTVNKATLTATAEDKSKEYGAANPAFTISYSGFKGSDSVADVDTAPTVSSTATISTNVGTATITATGGTDNNYTISTVNGTLTIGKAILTATAEDKSKEYGEANPVFTISYSGFKGSDSVADIDSAPTAASTASTITSVGLAVITAAGGADNNYTISTVNGILTIGKAMLTATADDKSKEYGDSNPAFTISYSGFKGSDSLADIDTAPTAASTATVTTNVGTYVITTAGGADNNYNITTVNGTLTIEKAMLTATADDKDKVFGKVNPTFTITYNGFVNADTPTDLDTAPVASTTATNNTPAGTVSISLSTGVDANYSITSINGTLTILADTDGDGDPDITDEDDDNDGVLDVDDNSPDIPNSDQQDTDGDGTPDVEEDCDNDGIINYIDTDTTSCTSAITQKKKYGFSPNGDGINDTWTIDNIYLYPNNTVKVFNRSGRMVFEQKAYKNTWNGISNKGGNGERLPVGPYLFIIELNDGAIKPIQGWLYINY